MKDLAWLYVEQSGHFAEYENEEVVKALRSQEFEVVFFELCSMQFKFSISETDREVLAASWGLEKYASQEPMTLEEIAKQLSITRERVRQIQARLIAMLRNPVVFENIEDYFALSSLLKK